MKKEKTMHELAKEFPEKTYRELERYRDADRLEEAIGIGHNHPPKEEQTGACIMGEMRKDREKPRRTESQKSQSELEPIEGEEQDNPELFKTEIDYHRYWKDMYEKEHKLRQEAETETILVKGIGMNSPEMKILRSEVEGLKQQLHTDSEKYKRENNDLYNRIADSLEVNESHRKMNGKLQERLTDLEEENKRMHDHLTERVDAARKSGL